MNFETILYAKENNVLKIILNRPDRGNAINKILLDELEQAINMAEKDGEVKVLVFSGKGKGFCAGGDVKEINFNSVEDFQEFFKKTHGVFNKIENIEKPTIAAINGYALGGGCEIALLCDIRIASEKSTIGLSEIKIGLLPGAGGTQRLPRLIGVSRALEMIYTGEPLDADTAYRIGLLNKIVPHERLMDEATKFAEMLANRSPQALKLAKKLVRNGINMDLKSGIEFETQCVSHLSFNAFKEVKKL
jgi:enoyl-CoA hydratase